MKREGLDLRLRGAERERGGMTLALSLVMKCWVASSEHFLR